MKSWKEDFVDFKNIKQLISPAGSLTSEESIKVYQQDYSARLFEAISKNYEATWVVLGDEDFIKLANRYTELYPSKSYSLNFYGDSFPEFLEKAEDIPLLCIQMAYFERAFWKFFHSDINIKKTLEINELASTEFILEDIELFESDADLKLIWDNKETGLNEELQELLFGEFFYTLFKANNKVEIDLITKNQYHFLKQLKERRFIEKIDITDLSLEDWSVLFKILSFRK